jgi:hypothetical protein
MPFEQKLNEKLNKGITARQALQHVCKHSPDSTISALAKTLIPRIQKEINIVVADLKDGDLGYYINDPPPPHILINNKSESLTATIMHEAMHAATSTAIESGEPEITACIKRLNEIKQHARQHLIKSGINPDKHYALRTDSHPEELVAEIFVDAELVQTLKNIPAKPARSSKLSQYIHSAYNQITEIIHEMIKGPAKTYPLVNEIMDITGGIILVNQRLQSVDSKREID